MKRTGLALLFVAGACASPIAEVDNDSIISVGTTSADYWTKERLRAAEALPFPTLRADAFEPVIALEETTAPDSSSIAEAEPADTNLFPYSTGGKLFFRLGSRDYYCSAEFVGSGSTLMTAAHCLYDVATRRRSRNLYFAQGYGPDGSRQVVLPTCAVFPRKWITPPRIRLSDRWFQIPRWGWDYGFIGTATSSDGGTLTLRARLPSRWEAIGYPRNYADGEVMHRDQGVPGAARGPWIVQMRGNTMRKGSSGGAWISEGFAIGLNSFGRSDRPGNSYGPYFNRETVSHLRKAARCARSLRKKRE
jgi:hypothetical protein